MSLLELYKEREGEIKNRLREFELAGYRGEKQIFPELCFCLLTPGTKAELADKVIRELSENEMIFNGTQEEIAASLQKRIRFHNNKARNIIKARELVPQLKSILRMGDNKKTRDWLVENVRGLGYKEASHFLRNVGHGERLAIIDRHILKNLKEFGFIDSVPKTITPKKYLELEERVKEFSEKIGIPMEELDLLLWSKQTGRVFK